MDIVAIRQEKGLVRPNHIKDRLAPRKAPVRGEFTALVVGKFIFKKDLTCPNDKNEWEKAEKLLNHFHGHYYMP